jgi:hypothetical protein
MGKVKGKRLINNRPASDRPAPTARIRFRAKLDYDFVTITVRLEFR